MAKSWIYVNDGVTSYSETRTSSTPLNTMYAEGNVQSTVNRYNTVLVDIYASGNNYRTLGNENFRSGTAKIDVKHKLKLLKSKALFSSEISRENTISGSSYDGNYIATKVSCGITIIVNKVSSLVINYSDMLTELSFMNEISKMTLQQYSVINANTFKINKRSSIMLNFNGFRNIDHLTGGDISSNVYINNIGILTGYSHNNTFIGINYMKQLSEPVNGSNNYNNISATSRFKIKQKVSINSAFTLSESSLGNKLWIVTSGINWVVNKNICIAGTLNEYYWQGNNEPGLSNFSSGYLLSLKYLFKK